MALDIIVFIIDGKQSGSYDLGKYGKDVVSFGRSEECDIVIKNNMISRCHGAFYKENGKWYVQDMDSRNGIRENGQKINGVPLKTSGQYIVDGKGDVLFIYDRRVEPSFVATSASAIVDDGRNQPIKEYKSTEADQKKGVSQPSERGKKVVIIVAAVVAALILVGIMIVIILKNKNTENLSGSADNTTESSAGVNEATTGAETPKTTESKTPITPSTDNELSAKEVFAQANNSTVEIITAKSSTYSGLGTGFFEDTEGTLITNYHVIDMATSAYIIMPDETHYDVLGVIGYDKELDIAILATAAKNTTPLAKRTDGIATGEKVYALGSSKGYSGTFTEGIVSTANRAEMGGNEYIQHTAPITNGNSGGPLLDAYGNVIGINSWGRTDGQNLNFAIPIGKVDNVKRSSVVSMQDVRDSVYGASSVINSSNTQWSENTIAKSGNRSVTAKLPDDFVIEFKGGNGTGGGVIHNQYVMINAELSVDDYSGDNKDEILRAYMEKKMDELQKKEGGDIEIERASGYINDEYWHIYFVNIKKDENISFVYMAHIEDDCLAFVTMVSSSASSQSTIDSIFAELIASITIK